MQVLYKKDRFYKIHYISKLLGCQDPRGPEPPDRLLTGSYSPGTLPEGSYHPSAFLAGSYHPDALLRCQDCRLLMMTTITTTRINGLAVGSWERSCKY